MNTYIIKVTDLATLASEVLEVVADSYFLAVKSLADTHVNSAFQYMSTSPCEACQ